MFRTWSSGGGKRPCGPAFCAAICIDQRDKGGHVNPGATAMEMWAMPLAALVKTLSLLRKTRVTRPNWLKCSLMAASGSKAGTPVRRTAVMASPGDQP